MEINYIVENASGILTNTQITWQSIFKSEDKISEIYTNYLLPILLLPVIGKFIGFTLVGYSLPHTNSMIRTPFMDGLKELVLSYGIIIIFIYVLALLMKHIIRKFEINIELNQSFKLVAFSTTPVCLAGILFVFPGFSQLVIFGAAYAIYILYQGVIEIVDEAGNKALTITVVASGVVIIFWIGLEIVLNEFVRSFPV
ncbi:MAG: YIP1 family protein [Calditrichaeota bacterium]|nr:MAG: YIP1 family protein [Calditrichota bacterium]